MVNPFFYSGFLRFKVQGSRVQGFSSNLPSSRLASYVFRSGNGSSFLGLSRHTEQRLCSFAHALQPSQVTQAGQTTA
jgi:hypothetical protein